MVGELSHRVKKAICLLNVADPEENSLRFHDHSKRPNQLGLAMASLALAILSFSR